MTRFWTTLLFVLPFAATAQTTQHNFTVGPTMTTCDSLDIAQLPVAAACLAITEATFRFEEDFKVSRLSGFMGASFHACDGKSGYMIVRIDGEDILFEAVPKTAWDSFVDARDPEGHYQKHILAEFAPVGPQQE